MIYKIISYILEMISSKGESHLKRSALPKESVHKSVRILYLLPKVLILDFAERKNAFLDFE